jgi:hypothetical protein
MKTRFLIVIAILGILATAASACTITAISTASGQSPVPGQTSPVFPAQANFRFLVSDQPNDIGNFAHLNVTISSIGVQLASDNSSWLQFSPDIGMVDLTTLQGKNAQEIWSGNITPGQYNKVFIYVGNVEGILASGTANGTANVKLPSGKLQISTPFTVSGNNTTSLVFDITVIKAGNSGKYILEPQIAQSGTGKEVTEVKPAQNQEQERQQQRNRLQLHLQGASQPGAAAVLVIMSQGKPVQGATVTVNGQTSGTTDASGKITITIPAGAVEVKIIATLGQNSGELDLEFGQNSSETEFTGTIAEINSSVWTIIMGGASQAVDVENARIEGNPQVGSTVDIKGVNNNGVVIASEISVQEGKPQPGQSAGRGNSEK